jgi:glycine/D-amino acid oxidase-like deaminating enzyme
MGYDVAVIGAGVHGCSAAAHLSDRGASVVMIDKGTVAGGPTGRSSAVCRAYYSNPFLARVARQSLDVLANFHEWSGGGHSGLRPVGLLFLHPHDDGPQLRQNAANLRAIGTAVEVLDEGQVAARFPEVAREGVGFGVWEPGGGPADPSGTAAGLWAMARARGAVARLNDEVLDLTVDPTSVRVHCVSGLVEADRVLIAAGPWTRRVAQMVGIDLPLTVERHYVTTNTWGSMPPMPYGIADVTLGFYLVPDGPTGFSLGQLFDEPVADPDSFLESVTVDEQQLMASRAVQRIPALQDGELRGGWASLYDVSPDWQPVIGEIAPGVFVDAGTSGHGFKLAPILGKHVADLVLDGVADPGLTEFHPDRFATGTLVSGGYGRARILG